MIKLIPHSILVVGLFLFLNACGNSNSSTKESDAVLSSYEKFDSENAQRLHTRQIVSSARENKRVGNFQYAVDVLSSYDFVYHKGEKIETGDMEDLKKESVILLEIETGKSYQNILDSKQLTMSKDELQQFLVGGIQKDISIEQNGEVLLAKTSIYEGVIGAKNKLRVMFLIDRLNRQDEYKIIYHDHLFDNGLVKFTINKKLES